VWRGTNGEPHPSLADAVFLNVVSLHALEAHPNTALEQGSVVVGARRVGGQSVGGSVGHGKGSGSRGGAERLGKRAAVGHIAPGPFPQTFSPPRSPRLRELRYSWVQSTAPPCGT